MLKTILACSIITTLVCPPDLFAQCGTIRHRAFSSCHTPPVIVKKVAVVDTILAVPVATFVPVPLYTASFTPPAPHAPALVAASAPASNDARILRALEAIEARLQALERQGGGPIPQAAPKNAAPKAPAAAPSSGLSIMQTKCAACHDAKTAAEKGGSFTLLNGSELIGLNDKQVRKIQSKIYKSAMPPASAKKELGIDPLTDEEVGAVMAHLDAVLETK